MFNLNRPNWQTQEVAYGFGHLLSKTNFPKHIGEEV